MRSIFVNSERCVACKSCEIACALNRSSLNKRLPEAIYESPSPLARVRVEDTDSENGFPIQCRHCEDAPCLDACPAKALYRDPEGLVLLRDERCIGCWMCVMVCPFGIINPSSSMKVAIKCDRCRNMGYPICAEVCPTQAIQLVDRKDYRKKAFEPPCSVKG